MELQILTPSKKVFSSVDAISVNIPGVLGYLGVLPGHAPLITKIGSGSLEVNCKKEGVLAFKITGGTLEISKNKVIVLSDNIEALAATGKKATSH